MNSSWALAIDIVWCAQQKWYIVVISLSYHLFWPFSNFFFENIVTRVLHCCIKDMLKKLCCHRLLLIRSYFKHFFQWFRNEIWANRKIPNCGCISTHVKYLSSSLWSTTILVDGLCANIFGPLFSNQKIQQFFLIAFRKENGISVAKRKISGGLHLPFLYSFPFSNMCETAEFQFNHFILVFSVIQFLLLIKNVQIPINTVFEQETLILVR